MAARRRYDELARQLGALGAARRGLSRVLPSDCPPGAAAVLTALDRYGEMRMSKLAELLAVDMSVTSRHVAYAVERGWISRHPDPLDGRCRLLRLTGSGVKLLVQISDRHATALSERLSGWSDEDVGRLVELLARLRAAFDEPRPRAAARPAGPAPGSRTTRTTRTTRTPSRT
ncbi:MarR family transcriptional regulator [Streptomyces sp. B1866]|uniref:MarR family winged helix-turn-helix transcriptional regulator n=1 Tax=Streptomyces sp. B1866 TaxID=3075431 RepID=UPI00288DA8EC|nr:MarR family transcriptional regulator [Streptomyces sp. B1866]MDT3396469.1 MarR family transcriptional regulator [Streptomyces sp. B1866]